MTFTYSSTNLSTDLAKVRLAIGDTSSSSGRGIKPDGSNFSDEELAIYIATATAAGQTWRSAVGPVLRVLANQYAAAARATTIGPVSEDLKETARALREQARDWERSIDADGELVTGASAQKLTLSGMYYTHNASGTVT